jgi:hypothetical protein
MTEADEAWVAVVRQSRSARELVDRRAIARLPWLQTPIFMDLVLTAEHCIPFARCWRAADRTSNAHPYAP